MFDSNAHLQQTKFPQLHFSRSKSPCSSLETLCHLTAHPKHPNPNDSYPYGKKSCETPALSRAPNQPMLLHGCFNICFHTYWYTNGLERIRIRRVFKAKILGKMWLISVGTSKVQPNCWDMSSRIHHVDQQLLDFSSQLFFTQEEMELSSLC